MLYPSIRRQNGVTVTVPSLNGGTNLHDDLTTVNDNQLTAANNMWWFRNALRTRPGMNVKESGQLSVGATGAIEHFFACNPINEREVLLGAMRADPVDENKVGTFFGYALDTENGLTRLGTATPNADKADEFSAMGVKASKGSETDYYFFLSSGEILQQGEEKTDGTPRELVPVEPYVPLVLVNGRGVETKEELQTNSANGDVYEGHNVLTNKFRCTYTTDGKAKFFKLPIDIRKDFLDVELTLYNFETKELEKLSPNKIGLDAMKKFMIATFNLDWMYWSNDQELLDVLTITIYLHLDGAIFAECAAYKDDEQVAGVHGAGIPEVASNNLVITVKSTEAAKADSICKMKRCVWFGGDRSGVDGGTRLFVTGNPDKPNLVHWSDVNNPLYFPENNYAYIGDGSEAATGFGKQGDILVIFKEHEIYYAQYVAGNEDDYEFAQTSGVEINTYMAKFPITPLHSAIGCDCPDSIRLVNNRLVWADSTGRVYMLPTVNQYNERNVREISPNIRPLLQKHSKEALQKAVAGEYNGYYTLLVDDKLYLLDTQNSAFVSFNYYSKENEAQRALPWYVWTVKPQPIDGDEGEWVSMVSDGDRMYLLRQPMLADLYAPQTWKLYEMEGETDEGEPISCSFSTKLFDFGRKDVRKGIMQLYIGLADSPESSVRVSYITDEYTAEDAYTIESNGDHQEGEPGYMRTHRLTPGVRRVRLFGIRCDSEGAMAVDGIQIKTKPQGVVR